MRAFRLRQTLLLLLTALVWGAAFVAQSDGMKYVGPFTFVCLRSILGGSVLVPVLLFQEKRKPGSLPATRSSWRTLIIGSILCGLCLAAASVTQQIGMQTASVGKAGFVTSCYIVLVPVLGLVLGRRCRWPVWIAVVLSLGGLWLLCFRSDSGFEPEDLWLCLSALLFAVHILVIDRFADRVNGVAMACGQFFTCALVCLLPMIFAEKPALNLIFDAKWSILYAGLLSSGVGYTLQIVGQRGMNPTVASLLMSLESVFSVLAGFVVLRQRLSFRELIGCGLMFLAVVLAQLGPVKKKQTVETQPVGENEADTADKDP